jgi:hypothetical protein
MRPPYKNDEGERIRDEYPIADSFVGRLFCIYPS